MALLQFGNFTNLILYLRIIVPSDPENSTSCILFHSTKPYVHQRKNFRLYPSLLRCTSSKPSHSVTTFQVNKFKFKKWKSIELFFFFYLTKFDLKVAGKINPNQSVTWKCYFALIWQFLFSFGIKVAKFDIPVQCGSFLEVLSSLSVIAQ